MSGATYYDALTALELARQQAALEAMLEERRFRGWLRFQRLRQGSE